MPRKDLTLKEKISALRQIENQPPNTSLRQLEKTVGLPKSTISRLLKQKEELEKQWINVRNQTESRKRKRDGKEPEVDEALNRWFCATTQRGVSVSGPMLKLKAEELAQKLGHQDFKATEGWFSRWKVRCNIKFKKAHGEKGNANVVAAEKWIEEKLPELLNLFSSDDIFNADETGLFYRATPDGSLCYRKDTLVGFKRAMDRITVLCCANMSGTEKKKLLVIGKTAKPRCFKGISINSLPVEYHSNKSAWMTADIFKQWLTEWDRQLEKKSRKIVLLIDNCPAHPHINNLKNIQLEFLPSNTTSLIQPMDMGVIKNFKFQYRKALVHHIIEKIEEASLTSSSSAKEVSSKVNMLNSIQFVADSWKNISSECIRNCFNHCGFKDPSDTQHPEQMLTSSENIDDEVLQQVNYVNDFLDIDANLECCNNTEDYESDIVEEIVSTNFNSNNEIQESSDEEIYNPIRIQEAKKSIEVLRHFFMQTGNEDSPMESLDKCAEYVNKKNINRANQSTLDKYFLGK